MSTTELVYSLALVTLAIVLAWGLWQLFRVRQAKRNNEHAALSDVGPLEPSHGAMERDPNKRN